MAPEEYRRYANDRKRARQASIKQAKEQERKRARVSKAVQQRMEQLSSNVKTADRLAAKGAEYKRICKFLAHKKLTNTVVRSQSRKRIVQTLPETIPGYDNPIIPVPSIPETKSTQTFVVPDVTKTWWNSDYKPDTVEISMRERPIPARKQKIILSVNDVINEVRKEMVDTGIQDVKWYMQQQTARLTRQAMEAKNDNMSFAFLAAHEYWANADCPTPPVTPTVVSDLLKQKEKNKMSPKLRMNVRLADQRRTTKKWKQATEQQKKIAEKARRAAQQERRKVASCMKTIEQKQLELMEMQARLELVKQMILSPEKKLSERQLSTMSASERECYVTMQNAFEEKEDDNLEVRGEPRELEKYPELHLNPAEQQEMTEEVVEYCVVGQPQHKEVENDIIMIDTSSLCDVSRLIISHLRCKVAQAKLAAGHDPDESESWAMLDSDSRRFSFGT